MDKVKYLMEKSSQILVELQKIKKLTEAVEEMQNGIAVINSSLDGVTLDISSLESNVDNLENEVDSNTSNINTLSQSLSSLTTNVNNISENVEEITSQISSITNNIETLTSNIEGLTGDVDKNKTDISSLQSSVSTINSEIDSLDSELSELSSDVSTLLAKSSTNSNFLINSNFYINQRGNSYYDENNAGNNQYTVDRLIHCDSNEYSMTPQEKGGLGIINFSKSDYIKFGQYIEEGDKLLSNKQVTLSVCVAGVVHSLTTNISLGESDEVQLSSGYFGIEYLSTGKYMCYFRVKPTSIFNIHWWKLELGSEYTTYSPRTYAEEMILCRRYFRKDAHYNSLVCVGLSNSKVITYVPIENMRGNITLSNIDLGVWIRGNGAYVDLGSVTPSLGPVYGYSSASNAGVEIQFDKSINISANRLYIMDFISLDIDAEIY